MPAYIFDPVNTFREAIPEDFLENSLRLLFDVHVQAYTECLRFPRYERRDIRAHHRRALFEWRWRELAQGYRDLLAIPVPNSKVSAFHTEVSCGSIILVESHVANQSTIVRSAEFRESLTMRYQPLFEEQNKEPEKESLFAILIHGAADERTPAFAHIVFPLRDEDAYHDRRIDLFDWFAGMVAARRSFQEELIADNLEPELREDVPNVGSA
jgi:hypothetical protein